MGSWHISLPLAFFNYMDNGFIVLHRKMKDWQWYSNNNARSLFIHLILFANHSNQKWENIEIGRGQIVTGIHQLAKTLGIKQGATREAIKRLKSTNEITVKSTNKYSIITIVKYDDYQLSSEKTTNKPTNKPTNEQQTDNKQPTTNNNDNNDNNDNNNIILTKVSKKEIKEPETNLSKSPVTLSDLYANLGLPKQASRKVSQWQDEAANAVKYFFDGEEKRSSIFKAFKDNNQKARIAFSDCKELGKTSALYFFSVFNKLK